MFTHTSFCEAVLCPALEENRNRLKRFAVPLPLCCLWCVDVVQFISARIYSAHTVCQAWCSSSKWIWGTETRSTSHRSSESSCLFTYCLKWLFVPLSFWPARLKEEHKLDFNWKVSRTHSVLEDTLVIFHSTRWSSKCQHSDIGGCPSVVDLESRS